MAFLARISEAICSGLDFHIRRYALIWIGVLPVLLLASGALFILAAPPRDFPAGEIFIVRQHATAGQIARELAETGIVRHPEVLRLLWRVAGVGGSIPAGAYRFAVPQNVFTVAWRLPRGVYGIAPARITFVEGTTVREMSIKLEKAFPEIPASDFLSAAQPFEGHLFPDTYSFPPSATADSVVKTLRETFTNKTAPLTADIAASGHALSDIVIMASIIEREARTREDRRMVSGILWNRIKRGMPLQVDAVFGYIYGRTTYSPSFADLKIDSPYNTYKYPGLPAGPICNPGLSSIDAALHPTKTTYVYYLTGRDGLMRYSTTYEGHKANLNTYLK